MPQETVEGFRLSPQQEQLWLLQGSDDSAAYTSQCVVLVRGQLDSSTLERAWLELVERNEILRTTFYRLPEMRLPVQVINGAARLAQTTVDLSGLSEREQFAQLTELSTAERRRSFDFERGPLLRILLARLHDESHALHALIVTLPAMCADAFSLKVLIAELARTFAGRTIEEQPLQYADLSQWLYELMEADEAGFGRDYWKKQQALVKREPRLPFEQNPSTGVPFEPETRKLTLNDAVVRELAQRCKTSTDLFLQACWHVLLWRLTGEPELMVGTEFSGRRTEELRSALGLVARSLPVRIRIGYGLSFREVLNQVTEENRQVAEWQDSFQWESFEGPAGPLPGVAYSFAETWPPISAAGLTFSFHEQYTAFHRYKIKLQVVSRDAEIFIQFHYDRHYFKAPAVERLAAQFKQLIESLSTNCEATVEQLDIIGAGEGQLVLHEFNDTATNFNAPRLIHVLFEQQVEATPDAVAVVYEGEQLTYRELNERANRVAHRLLECGAGPDTPVAISLGRSLEMITGLLAIMKAGAAYLPLDPSLPGGRISLILADAGARLVLTRRDACESLPSDTTTLYLDDWSEFGEQSARNPRTMVTPDNLAYIIYTSGSTGAPKGVMIPHRAITNRLLWMQQTFPFNPSDTLLQKTIFSFDASVWELFVPLFAGARLLLAGPEAHRDTAEMVRTISEAGVTLLQLTPTLLRVLLGERDLEECRTLRYVFSGGEALPYDTAALCYRKLRQVELVNLYGPTEVSIDATYYECPRAEAASHPSGLVPIGRPLSNVRVYVLDALLRPAPLGVAGELYVGGAGLARGYLGRPDLTAERFIPDPYSAEPGARLYRTGDLARHLEDGRLEFLGRIDQQVKVRGYRIEPGEIETVLGRHAGVSEAVVAVREDVPGDQRLVAYVVLPPAANGHSVTTEQLQAYLAEQLPDYMVPAAFVFLPELPTLPSGKLDRKALPAPEWRQPDAGKTFAPRTPIEEVLVGIWSQLFGVHSIGLNNSFFDLGGHSLMVTQVMSRVRQLFNVSIPLRSLFEGPTIAELAQRIESALQQSEGLNVPPLRRVERDSNRAPLSFGQQRLWFLHQLDQGSPVYNLPSAIRLKGPLDIPLLQRTVNEIVRRHESLRTTFAVENGNPVQLIHPPSAVDLPVTDLSELAESERESQARQLVLEEALKPFDLHTGPLMRVGVLRLGAEDHVAMLNMHHIIGDGWSSGVLVRELGTLYQAFIENAESPLPELAIQYADYAVWQREWLQGEELERQLAYWRKQLAGELPVLQLPLSRPRPAVQTFNGDSESLVLSRELTQSIKEFSRSQGVTLFMTLLAAFQALLHRYTGQDDIPVGTPIANRNLTETEPLIGFFANTLVLRADLSGDPSFRELLGRVRQLALGAYSHQDLPFEKLVEELQPGRELSHSPLFQVMFLLSNTPASGLDFPALNVNSFSPEGGPAKFDLTLAITDEGHELAGSLGYNTDVFDAATIVRFLRHFQHLVQAGVTEPDRPLSRLRLLAEDEREQLLYEWNDAARRDYPALDCIHDVFERQAALTPDAVAVVANDAELSYRELDERASRLADRLRDLGVGPEVRVGVLLGRSSRMLLSILAILKAGGAYVPLDPNYPLQRLRFMLGDSGARIVLTERQQVERWRAEQLLAEVDQLIVVDGEWEVERVSATRAHCRVTRQNLAYIIYTSGSTGTPKGIAITHSSTVTLLDWARETFAHEDLAAVLAGTSMCFDLSVYELFVPLSVGGQVIIAENVLEWPAVAAGRVRLINTVPSVMTELLRSLGGRLPAGVRVVNLAGEALPRALVEAIYDAGEVKQVWNLYGPSEDTTYSTGALIERGGALPPIGGPVANTRAYIVDTSLEPVPVGVTGELCLAGAGLARGYLGRPELTAERFIPDPFSREPSERMYLTGDLARYLPDGQIEYLGRADQQVKIHGFRIELGEIEAVLGAHERVREVVVMAREDVPGDKRVVAYYTASGDAAPSAADLRAYMRERVPEYLAPAAFVELDQIPLTPSGKADRRALPPPENDANRTGYIAPRTPAEEIVAGIWAEVLGVERIGVADNFFDLGGHSLLATQAVARICESFGVELQLRKIFEKPTVESLAADIDALVQEARGTPPIPPLVPAPRKAWMPLSFAQQRLWFLSQLEPDSPFYNVTAAVRLAGPLEVAALEQALNEILRRHETLRTTFTTVDGHPVQVIAPELVLDVPVLNLEAAPPDERNERARRLALEESQRPFVLEHGPLFRASVLRLGEAEHVIILGLHHIISDAWSLTLLLQELTTLYEAFSKGEASPLATLPIQYADFAYWQRSWFDGEEFERQLAYWRAHLRGAPPLLELPLDRPRPPAQTYNGSHVSFDIGAAVTGRLAELSRRSGATLFMTLLAAFKVLLARYSGQTDILIGSPIANRRRVEVEKLIGFFTNTLVLRTDLSGDPTFRELLGRVRETALGAYAHQDLPFEKLVEELDPERAMSHSPLFQVMFGLRNIATADASLSEGKLTPLAAESTSSKFDLSLFMSAEGELLHGRIEYNTDLFDHETITRMAGHFERLLAAIADAADQRIMVLPLLSEAERHLLLADWNDTEMPVQQNLSMMELLRPCLAQTPPDRVALIFEDEQVTYGELAQRSNRLAHRLRRLGIGPDSIVAVGLERSVDLIVALLATFKAGAAYLPLDLAYPAERLGVMLDDAQPPVILTYERHTQLLSRNGSHVVFLDAEREALAQESREEIDDRATGDNLGYVLYTSGSTGKPKGVAMRQAALANLIAWQARVTPSGFGVRSLQFASIGFDVSFQEIFTSLYTGGTLVLVSHETRLDSQALLRVITEQQIERMILPVVTLQQLAETAERLGVLPPYLRDVTTAGDRLQITQSIASWLGKLGCTMHNQCGPSETHCIADCGIEGESSSWPVLPPIGRPIDNARLYILDAQRNPVPVGVTGELYIGGHCLARGYLNRPELTAERFVPDHFSADPGARLYKTGDLVRFRRDGQIEFLGRNDFQVKIRGMRIELGEIEAVLSEHPSVIEAVAVVREDTPGQKRLVAYVVVNNDAENATVELRNFLKERLPDYMVPPVFVTLDHLPLSQNGKVDRPRLPAPDLAQNTADIFVAPRSPVEEVVAGIYTAVTGVDRVGVTDNFFDLGGHSLLATLVMSRIRDAFDVELPLRNIFEEPTVAGLSRLLEAELFADRKIQAPAIVAAERSAHAPLTFLQEHFWRRAQTERPTFYHIETRLEGGPLDVAAFERTINEVIRRHEILRTTFAEVAGRVVQVVRDYEPARLSLLDLGELAPAAQRGEIDRLSALQMEPPFDLSLGPLIRTSLLRLNEEEHILLLSLAHIVADAWSLKVFSHEVATLYDAFSKGEPATLPELPIQYGDYACWQRSWLRGAELERQVSYWRERLAGAPSLLQLPLDRPRPAVQSYFGSHLVVEVEPEVHERLQELSRREGVTLFMTMLAAFKALLARYSGQPDVVVGTATAGRSQVVTEAIIGVFVNPVMMRTDLSGDPTFIELLGRVRETSLGAYAHQEVPFEAVLKALSPPEHSSYSPVAQVSFVLSSRADTEVVTTSQTGLRMVPRPIYTGRPPYDLIMRTTETPEKLVVALEYNTAIFDGETITRLLADNQHLLRQAVANPDTRLSRFELSRDRLSLTSAHC